MRFFLFISLLFFFSNCSKPKTVLICGDHVCINKTEAEQYFEENLSIEVKIIDKNVQKDLDLVELNLRESSNTNRSISLTSKKNTNKELKNLSIEEIIKIKQNIKNKKKSKQLSKKTTEEEKNLKKLKKLVKKNSKTINSKSKHNISENASYKKNDDVFDVCTILKKFSIVEISKYLLGEGKKKDFPDITTKQ